jgi:hypothetical protein
MKGFKVTKNNMQCRGYQFELGKKENETRELQLCQTGFHFCEKLEHCFNYYEFDKSNRVFEILAEGEILKEGDKSCCQEITLVRELTWDEVLREANSGYDNTGHSNSGNWNSGNRNSGNRNSGNWNSGDSNSGDSNSGNRNSGNRNSGNWNSGNWNSGDSNSGNWNSGNRNSGDSNSGYRNSGAFCVDTNPVMFLFDKPCNKMTVLEWESSRACKLMSNIDPTIWVPSSIMSESEKVKNPKWETTEGYLKTISMKDAWANFWGNLNAVDRSEFTSLENFDAAIFFEITGITV